MRYQKIVSPKQMGVLLEMYDEGKLTAANDPKPEFLQEYLERCLSPELNRFEKDLRNNFRDLGEGDINELR